jgi:hypothetical protein
VHALRIVVAGKGKVVFGIQPPMVGATQAVKAADLDHVDSFDRKCVAMEGM